MPPRTRSSRRRCATSSSDGGLLGVLGALDASDGIQKTTSKPTVRASRKTTAVTAIVTINSNDNNVPLDVGEKCSASKSSKLDEKSVPRKTRSTRATKPLETKKSDCNASDHSNVTMANPPCAIVSSKMSMHASKNCSSDSDDLSELSMSFDDQTGRRSSASYHMQRPIFNRADFHDEDNVPLRPKAIFPEEDEDATAEGGDEFSDSGHHCDDEASFEGNEGHNHKQVVASEEDESFKEKDLSFDESGSDKDDESTQEQEFHSDQHEDEPEEVFDDDAADSGDFIVETDDESDFEEDYESESDDDEDLEVDSDDAGEHHQQVKLDSHVPKYTRTTRRGTRFKQGKDILVAQEAVDNSSDSEAPPTHDSPSTPENRGCKATVKRSVTQSSVTVKGSVEDCMKASAFDTESQAQEQDERREEQHDAVTDHSLHTREGNDSLSDQSQNEQGSGRTSSDTEDDESFVGATSDIESLNGEVEVVAQILADTNLEDDDDEVVYVTAEDVDDVSQHSAKLCETDYTLLASKPQHDNHSFSDADRSSLDDGEETVAFDIHDDDECQRGQITDIDDDVDGSDCPMPSSNDYRPNKLLIQEIRVHEGYTDAFPPIVRDNVTEVHSVFPSKSSGDSSPKQFARPEMLKTKSTENNAKTLSEDKAVRGIVSANCDTSVEPAEESFFMMDETLALENEGSSPNEKCSADCHWEDSVRNDISKNNLAVNVLLVHLANSDPCADLAKSDDETLHRIEVLGSSLRSDRRCRSDDHSDLDASQTLCSSWKQRTDSPDSSKENQINHLPPERNISKNGTREGTIRKGKWSLGSKIGTGSFGVVHIGMNLHTGQLMAVKSVELCSAAIKDVRVEVDLLKSLSHINIVRYLGAERIARTLHIFQEWVPGGSVTTLLNKFGPFSASVMRSYLLQIVTGLTFLHENRILHRDIKGGNVLISDDGIVKLADFGSAKRLAHQDCDLMESLTMRGTPYFMAPEVFQERYNAKADIWSVGCVAIQMATGLPPWKVEGFTNPMSLFLHLQNSEGLPTLNWPDNRPIRETDKMLFEEMLKRCFWRAPSKRPTAQGLASDEFFSGSSSSEEDGSRTEGLFSPGGDTVSTFAAKTPHSSGTPPFAKPPLRSPFLSPPMPRQIGIVNAVNVSPLERSPKVDPKDWPSWARDHLKKELVSPVLQQQGRKRSPLMDSLDYSADTSNSAANPFARVSSGSGRDLASLTGLDFVDGSVR